MNCRRVPNKRIVGWCCWSAGLDRRRATIVAVVVDVVVDSKSPQLARRYLDPVGSRIADRRIAGRNFVAVVGRLVQVGIGNSIDWGFAGIDTDLPLARFAVVVGLLVVGDNGRILPVVGASCCPVRIGSDRHSETSAAVTETDWGKWVGRAIAEGDRGTLAVGFPLHPPRIANCCVEPG